MLAVVWHYWIAVPLAATAVLAVAAVVAGYLIKVTALRYRIEDAEAARRQADRQSDRQA